MSTPNASPSNRSPGGRHMFDLSLDPRASMDAGVSEHKTVENLSEQYLKIGVEAKEYREFNIDHEDGIFCVKWSPDGQLLAIGCSDGDVRIVTRSGRLVYRLRSVGSMPCTALRWRPGQNVDHVLVTANAAATIQHWHVQSQKPISTVKEEENQTFCLDIRNDGAVFATGGMDRKVRVYDDQTKKLICTMERGYVAKKPGHSNRLFALKFKPNDPNVIVTGSWDNTILCWDMRTKGTFRSIYGPHIAGQSVDLQGEVIVTGSWRAEDTVQTWEFASGKLLNTVSWNPSPMVYSCQFSPDRENIVAAGGTGLNTARLMDVKTGAKSPALSLPGKKGIYTLDFDPTGNLLALAGHSDVVSLFSLRTVKFD